MLALRVILSIPLDSVKHGKSKKLHNKSGSESDVESIFSDDEERNSILSPKIINQSPGMKVDYPTTSPRMTNTTS
ncbi:unnamed protein product [Larinioides sclopetarius]|uniref:Uncharacterized protein n=1 Tax=Larinioides sclopetarius TaxID=280406 RepID=A0AAV2AAA8_9ARAC